MTVHYRVWSGEEWLEIPGAHFAGEALVMPTVAAIVYRDGGADEILLQRRDKEGEVVRGLLEIPTGRWRAGESPAGVLRREVAEETGVEILAVSDTAVRSEAHRRRPFVASHPDVVVVGVDGAYPALLVAYVCIGRGEPVPQPGETADVAWRPVADVRDLLDVPERFTGAAFAVLTAHLGLEGTAVQPSSSSSS